MEEDKKVNLYIPANIRKRKEIIDGIALSELLRIGIGSGIGLFIGILAYIKYQNFIVLLLPGVLCGIFVFTFVRKDISGRSTLDRIKEFISFLKSQKKFYYKYSNIYEKDVEK